jgi:TatD DNase family protein
VLVDTHCHLGDRQFDGDRADAVARARAAAVGHVIVIADSLPSSQHAIIIASQHGLSATAGVHPHEASSWNPHVADGIAELLADPAVVAVGEIGLDYHYDHSPREAQRTAFAAQLEIAADHDMPAVVHARSADEDMTAMLRDTRATVILHSFSSGPTLLELALERQLYVSFSGMVTFRSWTDEAAVQAVPDDRLLVETDSPYLAPVPHRGRRNEPAYVVEVARRVAELRGQPAGRIAALTTANAGRCFGPRVIPTQRKTS